MSVLGRLVPSGTRWIKAERSNTQGNQCVEVAQLEDGTIAVRDSKHPEGPTLLFTPGEMGAFLAGVKAGEFDHLVVTAATAAV